MQNSIFASLCMGICGSFVLFACLLILLYCFISKWSTVFLYKKGDVYVHIFENTSFFHIFISILMWYIRFAFLYQNYIYSILLIILKRKLLCFYIIVPLIYSILVKLSPIKSVVSR